MSERIFERDTVVPLDNNSPDTCTAACGKQGFTIAGTEYSGECHCGVGFTS